jgi:hypothetical protein
MENDVKEDEIDMEKGGIPSTSSNHIRITMLHLSFITIFPAYFQNWFPLFYFQLFSLSDIEFLDNVNPSFRQFTLLVFLSPLLMLCDLRILIWRRSSKFLPGVFIKHLCLR